MAKISCMQSQPMSAPDQHSRDRVEWVAQSQTAAGCPRYSRCHSPGRNDVRRQGWRHSGGGSPRVVLRTECAAPREVWRAAWWARCAATGVTRSRSAPGSACLPAFDRRAAAGPQPGCWTVVCSEKWSCNSIAGRLRTESSFSIQLQDHNSVSKAHESCEHRDREQIRL